MEDYTLARVLYAGFVSFLVSSSSKQQISALEISNLEKSDIVDIIYRLEEAFVVDYDDEASRQAIAGLFDILSEKDRIRIIDIVAGNCNGVEISKVEKSLEGSKDSVSNLIEQGIIEQSKIGLITQGPNMDKAIICLEILRKSIIMKENREVLLELLKKGRVKDSQGMRPRLGRLLFLDADLSRADLSGADLSGADLSGVNLGGVNLTNADLSGADLSGVNLGGVNLGGVNLGGVNLGGVNLTNADLSGVNLTNADLSGAILVSNEGLVTPYYT